MRGLTTHHLEEADQLAQQIVIIDQGRAIAAGTAAELKSRAGHDMIDIRLRSHADVESAASALAHLGELETDAPTRVLRLTAVNGSQELMAATQALLNARVGVENIALRRPTLDEVFLHLTGQPPAAPAAASTAASPSSETSATHGSTR